MDEPNPYQPTIVDEPIEVSDAVNEGQHWGVYVSWTTVFGLNLALPLIYARSMTNVEAMCGVIAATIVFYSSGIVSCYRLRRRMMPMVWGSLVVGVSQVLPIIQLIVGMVAIRIASVAGLVSNKNHIGTFLGGFVVTSIVCFLVMAVSAGLGYSVYLVLGNRNKDRGTKKLASQAIDRNRIR